MVSNTSLLDRQADILPHNHRPYHTSTVPPICIPQSSWCCAIYTYQCLHGGAGWHTAFSITPSSPCILMMGYSADVGRGVSADVGGTHGKSNPCAKKTLAISLESAYNIVIIRILFVDSTISTSMVYSYI